MKPPVFCNPYDGTSKDEIHRTTINIPRAKYAELRALYTKSGVLQTTVNTLLEKLLNELKRQNFTEFDPARFEVAVGGCAIVLGGYSNSGPSYGVPATCNGPGPVLTGAVTSGQYGSSSAQPSAGKEPAQPPKTTQGNERSGASRVGRAVKTASHVAPDSHVPPPRRRNYSKKTHR